MIFGVLCLQDMRKGVFDMNDRLLTPKQLCEVIPNTTPNYWATLRFKGQGPAYLKPSPKRVYYRESVVWEWLSSTERHGTAEGAA